MTLSAFLRPACFRPVALAAALALAPAVAGAFPLNWQNNSNVFGGPGGNAYAPVTISSAAGPHVGPLAVYAGGFALKGNLYGNGVENFTAFCLDIATHIRNGKNYEVTQTPFQADPLTATQISYIGKLFDMAYGTLNLSDAAQSAGFQLALWEIIYETGPKFVLLKTAMDSGNFTASVFNGQTVSSDAITKGQGFLDGLASWSGPKAWNLTFLESRPHHSQNLVTATPVPLPAAAALLLAALGGLGLMRRRKAA